MRFETMGNIEIPKYYVLTQENGIFSIEATPEEKEALDTFLKKREENLANGLEATADITRAQLNIVSKLIEPFKNYASAFIDVQKGRGNSPQTIKHYEQTIKKMEIFFCWLYCKRHDYDYSSLKKEDRIFMGENIPFGILEDTSFDADFREFLLDEEEVSLQTVSTYFRDYRAIAYYGMDEGLIRKKNIVVKTVESEIKEVYTDEEIDKLLKEPSKDASFTEMRSWAVINWILATGNRVGTVVNVKIKDVDFDENMININNQKNKRVMRIPMIDSLRRTLNIYINDCLIDDTGHYISPYLFPSSDLNHTNMPTTRQNMGRSIALYNNKRGVSKTSIHLFRHTFVKNWIVKGGDLHSLQKILGHSTLDMVVHYANLITADLKPKMEDYSVLATHKAKSKGKMIKRRSQRR